MVIQGDVMVKKYSADTGYETQPLRCHGCGTLFGFASVSDFVKQLAEHVPGRLLVLFPGEYINNGYRLLDARDGWGYQATAITADN